MRAYIMVDQCTFTGFHFYVVRVPEANKPEVWNGASREDAEDVLEMIDGWTVEDFDQLDVQEELDAQRERAFERWSERSTESGGESESYRETLKNAGRGHLLQ